MSLAEKKITTNAGAVFSEMSVPASRQMLTKKLPKETTQPKPLKKIPVRQTLTSKLRMIKAASIVSSEASDKAVTRQFSRAAKTPVRRPHSHRAAANGKQPLDFIGTFSERTTTVKKSLVIYQQKNVERELFKENKPPHIRISQKFVSSKVEFGGISSKLTRKNVVDKCNTSRFIYKKNILSIQNRNKSVRTPNKNNQFQPWDRDKTVPQCNHNKNYLKSGRNTPLQAKVLNNNNTNKRRAFNTAEEDAKNSNDCFHTEISNLRPCNITREDSETKDVLTNAKRTSKESALVSVSKNQLSHTGLFQDGSNAHVFNSRRCNFTSNTTNVATSIYPDSIKRVEEWLNGSISKQKEHILLDSKSDESRTTPEKAVKSLSVDSMNSLSWYRKEGKTCYDDKCRLSQDVPVNVKENFKVFNQSQVGYSPKTFEKPRNFYDECNVRLAVSKSRPPVKDFAKYWEYLTGLEKARSDFSSEVNHYGQAILNGADVQLVERNLRNLEGRFRDLKTSWQDGENSRRNLIGGPHHICTQMNFERSPKHQAVEGSSLSKVCQCSYCPKLRQS